MGVQNAGQAGNSQSAHTIRYRPGGGKGGFDRQLRQRKPWGSAPTRRYVNVAGMETNSGGHVPPPELNEPQAEAVAHGAGPLLVFAGAGSGKTRVITYRVAHLLAVLRVPPYRILAVTFTNKAAGEMRERIAALAGPELTSDLWVGTFHAVCARLLRRHHAEVGLTRQFTIYDESDQKAVISRVLKDRGLDERSLPPKVALNRISAQKREGRGPDQVQPSRSFDEQLLGVYQQYQSALTKANAVDFDDLILHIMRLAEDPNSPAGRELRERFEHVLVDEFQDTNLIQYRLVRALATHTRNLCVVGDDDQSIYRWRGADVRLIRGFHQDFADARLVKLEQNYRSAGNIVRAALGVIEPAAERAPKRLWTAASEGEKVHVRAVRDERDEAEFVARVVAEERARGLSANDIAVFYRVHAQSRVLEETLRSHDIPYQVVGGMRFFERAEVKDVLAYLRLIDNPRSDADLTRIINVPARGIGSRTLERLLQSAAEHQLGGLEAIDQALQGQRLGTAPKKKLAAFRDLMQELREASATLTPHALAELVLDKTGYREALLRENTAEADARLGNLQELLGSIAQYETSAGPAEEEPTLQGYLERVSLITAVDTMRDAPCVSLMTVHAAKGLEFETVLLTGMEEETFPYRGLDESEEDDLEEERRLAYVAITRAGRRLWITHAGQRSLFGRTRYLESSRFLRDLPPEAICHEGSPAASRRVSQSQWPPSVPPPSGARWSSPAGMPLQPGQRFVDRDAFDDLPPDEPSVSLQAGDRVIHPRFGEGVVERIEPGGKPIVVATFPGHGKKRIVADYLQPA
jgi:DNA helicase-2/ATP-dependent DNA helicase PcrA